VGKPNPCWKKEDDTTISLVFDVGISSPFSVANGAPHGQEGNDTGLALGFRSHLLWIFWNIFGREAAMVRGEGTLSGNLPNRWKWRRCARGEEKWW
jgi:hypothetical protein